MKRAGPKNIPVLIQHLLYPIRNPIHIFNLKLRLKFHGWPILTLNQTNVINETQDHKTRAHFQKQSIFQVCIIKLTN